MSSELNPSERETLEVFLIVGHEVAATALKLGADYVSAQLRLGSSEIVVFAYDDGAVTVTGRGFEVELSRLAQW